MKHETINSIIAALGLCLASVTAWHQFAPASDAIELTTEGRVNLGRGLEIEPLGPVPLFGDETHVSTAGPVAWKVRVYNASDRPVSIVSFSVYLLDDSNGLIEYSTMKERLSSYDSTLAEQRLPENIDGREAKAFLVSLSMPFLSDEGDGGKCEDQETSLSDLERCFFLKGRDLFGNSVSVTKYGEDEQSPISVSWDEAASSPQFVLVFETADGSNFETRLTYFPNF